VSETDRGPIKDYAELFERTIANYVPGEVCIVTTATLVERPGELYETVRQSVNRTLTNCVRHPTSGTSTAASRVSRVQRAAQAGSAFARDLDLADLSGWVDRLRVSDYGAGGSDLTPPAASTHDDVVDILRPLPPRKVPRDPWIVLPRRNAPSTFICFFGLNPAVVPSHQQIVRQVVNCVNVHAVGLDDERLLAVGSRVVAATPNWLTIGAADHGCGSPAGPPAAIPTERAPETRRPLFVFGNASLEAAMLKAADVARGAVMSDVVVAILDTSPRAEVVQVAATPPDPRANWLMREVAETVHLDGALSLAPAYFDFLSPAVGGEVLPNWQGPEVEASGSSTDADRFRMTDHGLFAAGIVRHLAPRAEIHLIRVLGDDGVGDLFAIISTLSQLPRVLQTSDRRRLVVNLSLGADIPIGERLLARWFPHSYADPATLQQQWVNMCKVCEPIDRALNEVVNSLDEQGVLLIAAVGNDAFTLPVGRKEPRYPARYENVLGVTATKRTGHYADYANLGDEAIVLDDYGVAAYGGNAVLPDGAGSGPPRIDTSRDDVDAIVGIFSAPSLPGLSRAPRENRTGWVYWAGTSFATPIVSAVAANLWLQSPGSNHHQIHQALLVLGVPADGPPSDGYPDVPVIQVLPA
jgi:hypothetical protein